MGQASEELESCGSQVKESTVEEISKYLLLHHNYSARPQDEPTPKKRKSSTNKYKKIVPKEVHEEAPANIITIDPANVTAATLTDNNEVVYYTYDENTNSLVLYTTEDAEVEVVTSECGDFDSSSSESGYESHGSPHNSEDDDIWDKSISELFPTLA